MSRVSPKTVDDAVKALVKEGNKKSKTEKPQLLEEDEFFYLVVALKKIPQRNFTNAYRIPLPHPLINTTEDSPELCLIIDDRSESGLTKEDAKKKIKSENIPITKVVKVSELKSDYGSFESKRKLCDSYEMFFSDRRVIPLLPRLIGKKFFLRKKIPVAIDLKHMNWKEQIEKACGAAMFFMRTGTCSVIKVAKLSMESDEIAENVMATLNGVVDVLPSKWKYIRSLHLKLSESLALPLYQSVPYLKLKIDPSGVEEVRNGEELVKSDEVDDCSKSVKTKKKKGRIHEVRYMDSNVTETLGDDEIEKNVEEDEVAGDLNGSGYKKKRKKMSSNKSAVSEKPVIVKSKNGQKSKKLKNDIDGSGGGLKAKTKRR
ncbi:Ribosomal protein L1/ribosomal biogenesis protein [Arabidopsis suecica]|uniref:Ribosomal protein L1/ribosomal biogenesis protein n=1 Tax=Arabidopsis suecica TaxID=45249 RepID=A0A8T2ANY6_ARASU|nr:Ribosomal protein L1/ribosomal biogenesis protein [Arabidopsis suecica]